MVEQTSNPTVLRLQDALKRKGPDPKLTEAAGLMVRFGLAQPQDFQLDNRPLTAGQQTQKILESFPKGVAKGVTGLTALGMEGAKMVSPFAADLPPGDIADFSSFDEALDENLGFTPRQLQDLPTPISGTARGFQIAGESLPFSAGFFGTGVNILSTAGKTDIATMGALKRAFVDAARNPGKFAAIEATFSEASGVGGDLIAKQFGEDSRVFGELSTAFGAPFALGVLKTLEKMVGGLFGLSQKRAETLVGLAIARELEKNPEFARSLDESQALQQIIPGFRLDLAKATRSPSINKAANEIEFDASRLDIENRTAVDNFGKQLQASIGRVDEETGEFIPSVIRPEDPAQSGLPRAETLTAEAFQLQVAKVVDDEISAVQTQLSKLEQDFISTTARPRGDQFDVGEASFEKFLSIRGRADQNIKTIYNTLDGSLILPRQSFRGTEKAYQRALRVEAAGNDAPPEVIEMVDKMKRSFSFRRRGTVQRDTGIVNEAGQPITRRELEPRDARLNSFAAVREIQSELGAKASAAARAGDRPLARRYNILLAETNRILDRAVTQGGLPLDQARLLDEGNRLRRNFAKLFEDFEGRALFAKTNQTQMKVAFEDTLNIFIKPNSSQRSVSAIDNMKRIYGDSPATQEIIKNELLRRMQAIGETDGVLTLRGFQRFKKQYSNAINRAGLKQDFATIEQATKTFEDNISSLGQSQKALERSTLAHITKADDPGAFIEKALKNRQEFRRLIAAAQQSGDNAFKIFKGAVMETITNSTLMKQLEAGTERIPVLSGKILDKILIENGDEIKQLLGNQHFSKLINLQEALARSDPSRFRPRGGDVPASSRQVQQTKIQTFLSMIRQVEQRVLSPQFVATNLTVNNLLAVKSRVLREVWSEAMSDIGFASELVAAARKTATAPLVRSMFTPGLGILASEETFGDEGNKPKTGSGMSSADHKKALNPTSP